MSSGGLLSPPGSNEPSPASLKRCALLAICLLSLLNIMLVLYWQMHAVNNSAMPEHHGFLGRLQPEERSDYALDHAQVHSLLKGKSQPCDEYYGTGFAHRVERSMETFCGKSIVCVESEHVNTKASTKPHIFCHGTNVLFQSNKTSPHSCVKHRRGYKCSGEPIWLRYQKGAFVADCAASGPDFGRFPLTKFNKDHQRDIFESLISSENMMLRKHDVSIPTALFVTRERTEHANLFHSLTDFYNVYVYGTIAGVDWSESRIVLLDRQKQGPFDEVVWQNMYSAGQPPLRVTELHSSETVFAAKAVFIPPGYASMIYSDARLVNCQYNATLMFTQFVDHLLKAAGAHRRVLFSSRGTQKKMKVILVSRRPYNNFVEHNRMNRQTDNEAEVVAALEAVPQFEVVVQDMATLTFQQQVVSVSEADVVVGIHGAAIAHCAFLPIRGICIELLPDPLTPRSTLFYRIFPVLSTWSAHAYFVVSPPTENVRRDETGEHYTIHIPTLTSVLDDVQALISAWDRQDFSVQPPPADYG